MANFELDKRLEEDCLVLGEINQCLLLLRNNELVPWFILVPKTNQKELYQLEQAQQISALRTVKLLTEFIEEYYSPDKLNIATIGNIVEQLHIHIVGRFKNDYCWPGVVWGEPTVKPYGDGVVKTIREKLEIKLGIKID